VVGRALQAVYTIAIWVYVDETKIKARDRTYYLWLAVDEKGLSVFVHLSRRRDAWTALNGVFLRISYDALIYKLCQGKLNMKR